MSSHGPTPADTPRGPHATAAVGSPVESPCVRNCCLDAADVCLGCRRTLAEITAWSAASDTERAAILLAAEARARTVRPDRSG